MALQLRHRLILVWLGTIVLAMLIAAVLFRVLLVDFHQANAQARLLEGLEHFQTRIEEMAGGIRANGGRFAARKDIVSSLSMISRYQDPADYQSLVFDPEKKRLAKGLAGLVQDSGLTSGALYAGNVPVAGFFGGQRAFVSYDSSGKPQFWFAEQDGLPFVRRPEFESYSQVFASVPDTQSELVQLRSKASAFALVVEGSIPIGRDRSGGNRLLLGSLVLSQVLDQDVITDISRHVGLSLLLMGGRLTPVGDDSLPRPAVGQVLPELSRLLSTTAQPVWLPSDDYYAAAARLPLAEGGEALLVVGLDKGFRNTEVDALQLAMMLGLVIATLFVLGVGLLYLRRVLSRPLGQLLRGIEAVAGGRFVPVEGADKEDELGHVAAAFNQMAGRLEAQQSQLRALNADLEQRVRSRTTELVEARDSAEAANRSKSLFLANMSHELRTPLNAILGFAQLLRRGGNLSGEQQRDLLTINNSGRHLLALINDVLEISRIESGRLVLEIQAFNLPNMLDAVQEMIHIRAEKKGLSLHTELGVDLPEYVQGDEHRLRQVLINLLGNAVKYSEQGWVSVRAEREGDAAVRFEVEDTGPGIDQEDQKQLFQPFFQTQRGIAKGEGSGLGLAISREYVALMGGELAVESLPGKGSLFHFSIPLKPVQSSQIVAGEAERRVIGLEPGQRSYRVLIAEDNEDSEQVLRRMLENIELEVRVAADGRQALEQFEQWRPHLIWMDMRMPEMDGYEATRRIKAHPAAGGTVVVALTASAFEEDRADVLASGCDEFVRKPVTEEVVYEVLKRHLGLRFRYGDQAVAGDSATAMVDGELQARLHRLPGELQSALREAALVLDPQAAGDSIEQIKQHDANLAEALQSLLAEYRFEQILDLFPGQPGAPTDTEGHES